MRKNKVDFIWDERYSFTMQPDDIGRWARIAFVGKPGFKSIKSTQFEIAWIYQNLTKEELLFIIKPQFPFKGKYIAKTLDEAKQIVEEEFEWFINNIKYLKNE
jgi:hypothetical protein